MLSSPNADANNVAVFNVADRDGRRRSGSSRRLGIHVGAVQSGRQNALSSPTANGILPKSNRNGHRRSAGRGVVEYIAGLFAVTLSTVRLPSPDQMARTAGRRMHAAASSRTPA